MRRGLLYIASIVLLLAACESYDCTLYNHVGCYGAFYQDSASVSFDDTLTITAGKSGPVLLNKSVGTSRIDLPLSYWQDEDTLVLTVKGMDYLFQDTIWISTKCITSRPTARQPSSTPFKAFAPHTNSSIPSTSYAPL